MSIEQVGPRVHGSQPNNVFSPTFHRTIMLICSKFWPFTLFTLMNWTWKTMTVQSIDRTKKKHNATNLMHLITLGLLCKLSYVHVLFIHFFFLFESACLYGKFAKVCLQNGDKQCLHILNSEFSIKVPAQTSNLHVDKYPVKGHTSTCPHTIKIGTDFTISIIIKHSQFRKIHISIFVFFFHISNLVRLCSRRVPKFSTVLWLKIYIKSFALLGLCRDILFEIPFQIG